MYSESSYQNAPNSNAQVLIMQQQRLYPNTFLVNCAYSTPHALSELAVRNMRKAEIKPLLKNHRFESALQTFHLVVHGQIRPTLSHISSNFFASTEKNSLRESKQRSRSNGGRE